MGFCPDYPPCNMSNSDSASYHTLGANFTTVEETGLKILDKDRNVIVEYDLGKIRIHKLVPKIDAVKKLSSYIGQYIIYQMEIDTPGKEPEVIELKVLVTSQ